MVYHGTTKECADQIISDNRMKPSMGDRHWLGDGVYFYQDFFYALRWIRCKEKTDSLLDNYSIITAELNIDEERIFSLLNMEHKLLFQQVLEICSERLKRIGSQNDVVDGAILNIMFKEMKYGNKYDIVKASFIHEDKNLWHYSSRLCYIQEIQICVKNLDIISQLQKMEPSTEEIDIFLPTIDNFHQIASGVLKTKNSKYATRQRKSNYKG